MAFYFGALKNPPTQKLQAFQLICLCIITSDPWYITNNNLLKDIKISSLNQLAKRHYSSFHLNLSSHPNPLIQQLSSLSLSDNLPRRLKRYWPREVLK